MVEAIVGALSALLLIFGAGIAVYGAGYLLARGVVDGLNDAGGIKIMKATYIHERGMNEKR